jgi:PAS domain S-box-containing protein
MDDEILKYQRRIQELERENTSLKKTLTSQEVDYEKVKVSTLIEQMGDGISVADQTGAYILANPAFCHMTGYTESELLSMKIQDLLSPDVELTLFPTVLKNKSGQREVLLMKKDGSHFTAEVRGFPIQLDGRLLVLGIVRDISEKKKTEKALLERERNLQEIFNATSEGIAIHDIETGQLMDCNDATLHNYGYASKAEMLKLTVEDVSAVEKGYDNKAIAAHIQTAIDTNGHTFEWLAKKKNGDLFWVEVHLKHTMINGESRLLAVSRDISERKQAQQALRESEQKYTTLFDSLIDEVHVWKLIRDKGGQITGWSLLDANAPALKAWGKTKEAILGKTANEIFGYDAHADFLLIVEKIFKTGKPHRWEQYFEAADQYLSMDSIPFGDYFISTGKDISYLKKTEKALQASNATKDKFFSIIAHDLRTPFTGLIGLTELIKDNPRSFDYAAFSKIVDKINSTARDTLALLDNLLNWARSQTEQIKVEPEIQLLQPIVEDLFKLFQATAQKKNILLRYSEPEAITVLADSNMIKTVLRNLISNAIKFTRTSGSIEVRASQDDAFTDIEVSDTGVGMDEAALKNLFRLETNQSTQGTAQEKGTGLGLILCKDFVEKHGGSISVESQVGKGSTFKIRLPRRI